MLKIWWAELWGCDVFYYCKVLRKAWLLWSTHFTQFTRYLGSIWELWNFSECEWRLGWQLMIAVLDFLLSSCSSRQPSTLSFHILGILFNHISCCIGLVQNTWNIFCSRVSHSSRRISPKISWSRIVNIKNA